MPPHLSLSIWPEPGADSILADLRQLEANLSGQDVRQRHELRGLISSIAKHVTLVSSTQILQGLGIHAVHALANIRGLLLNVDKDLG